MTLVFDDTQLVPLMEAEHIEFDHFFNKGLDLQLCAVTQAFVDGLPAEERQAVADHARQGQCVAIKITHDDRNKLEQLKENADGFSISIIEAENGYALVGGHISMRDMLSFARVLDAQAERQLDAWLAEKAVEASQRSDLVCGESK